MENIANVSFPYRKFCDMENIIYVIFPYYITCQDTSHMCVQQAMYKKGGHCMTMRGKRQRENVPTLFDAVGGTTIFYTDVAPYCTPGDLASFALTCREALPCVMALTEQKIWPVSILLEHYKTQWTWTKFPERMSHVRRVHMDMSFTSLPGDMGLTSCKEVYFFPPPNMPWVTSHRDPPLRVHPAMFPKGVATLRFDDTLTQCDFGNVSDYIPASVQKIVHTRGYRNAPLKIPGSVKTLVYHMEAMNQLAVGVLPEGLTHLELVDPDFDYLNLEMMAFPQSLQYVKISMHAVQYFHAIPAEPTVRQDFHAIPAVAFLNSHRPDIVVEVFIDGVRGLLTGPCAV